jgi:rhamnosyltransferase
VLLLGSRGIPARYGGFETLVEALAFQLPKERMAITVFCESSLRKFRPEKSEVRLVYFPVFDKLRIISEVFFDIVGLIWSTLAPVEVTILFGYSAGLFCVLPRMFGKTVLVNVDGLEWKRSKFSGFVRATLRLLESMTARAASMIVCDSRTIQNYYERRYNVSAEYIPNPAPSPNDITPVHPGSLDFKEDSYYLVVARLEPENHVDMIIDGFVDSQTRKKLIIVGPLTNARYVSRLLELRTPPVLFLGGIFDRARLNALRIRCFAYIHGHEVGGTNPSLLEAMACGNAVLAYDVPFNREVARDSGLYFRTRSELAGKMRLLEENALLRENSRAKAKRIAQMDYASSLVASAYARLIENSASVLVHAARKGMEGVSNLGSLPASTWHGHNLDASRSRSGNGRP